MWATSAGGCSPGNSEKMGCPSSANGSHPHFHPTAVSSGADESLNLCRVQQLCCTNYLQCKANDARPGFVSHASIVRVLHWVDLPLLAVLVGPVCRLLSAYTGLRVSFLDTRTAGGASHKGVNQSSPRDHLCLYIFISLPLSSPQIQIVYQSTTASSSGRVKRCDPPSVYNECHARSACE